MKIPIAYQCEHTNPQKFGNDKRTIVYIDGQNFLHRCAESLIKSRAIESQQELTNIDLNYLFKRLFPGDEFLIRYYGVSKIKQRRDLGEVFFEKSERFASTLRQLRENFSSRGVSLRDVGQLKVRNIEPCRKCGHADYKFQEKGVDVGMAAEIVRDAILGIVDRVVLASSDMDMLPAIMIAEQFGAEVVYVGFKGKMTKSLMHRADETREISGITVLESYISAMNLQNVK